MNAARLSSASKGLMLARFSLWTGKFAFMKSEEKGMFLLYRAEVFGIPAEKATAFCTEETLLAAV